jgi:hypothetical protein
VKKRIVYFFLFALLIPFSGLRAQKTYSVTLMEFIFSFNQSSYTDAFLQAYPQAGLVSSPLRFTGFYHVEQDWHLDFTDNIGFFTGLGVRNIGMITDELLPATRAGNDMINYKLIRRVYTAGVPLAIKIGTFKKHVYLYSGGEIEMVFHYKEKYWKDTNTRSGNKAKNSVWFGEQTPQFMPSVMAGIQLPGGFNLRFKYYFNDFLNHKYEANSVSADFNVSDLTRYETSQLFYFSLSWQFNKGYKKVSSWQEEQTVAGLVSH